MVLVTSVFLEVRGNPEFASVDVTQAVRVPTAIDPVKAAACSDAAIALAMINNVVIGDRVLIVGGGDTTCGAAATELARLAGAAYIAITTGSLIHPIKLATQVDDVIGEGRYWVLEPKYLENMFDKIIYCSREDSDPSKINKVLKSNRDGGKLIHLRSYNHSNHRRSEGLSKVLQLLKDKKLEIILDPSSPHPFTEDGVESAYKLYTSGGDRGGIVVEVTL